MRRNARSNLFCLTLLFCLLIITVETWGDDTLLYQSSFTPKETENWSVYCSTETLSVDFVNESSVLFSLPEKGRCVISRKIDGVFPAGAVLRLSASISDMNVEGPEGKNNVSPYFINQLGSFCCLALRQFDSKGKCIGFLASKALLGTGESERLEVDVVVQRDVKSVEIQCRAVDVTGSVSFKNIRLENIEQPPMRELPDFRIAENENGSLYWRSQRKEIPWNFYFGNNQFLKDDVILDEMAKAVDAGVRVVSFNLRPPSIQSQTDVLKICQRFLDPFPEVYFLPRIWLGEGFEFRKSYPDEYMEYADGTKSPMASPSSKKWRDHIAFNLEQFISLIRRSPYADRFIGVMLTYQQTGEWVFWKPDTSAGYFEVTRAAFAIWAKKKYETIESLNSAWKTEYLSFDEIKVPSKTERYEGEFGLFRNPSTQQTVIDFTDFYHHQVPNLLDDLGGVAKSAGGGRGLVGCFYGYVFENCWGNVRPQQAGHLGLDRLLRSKNIDFFGSPYSYNKSNRRLGFPTNVMNPTESGPLHGKPTFIEEDTFTHLAEEPKPGTIAPGYAERTTTLDETLAVLKRNLGTLIAHNQILLWQNLLSDGRFNDPEIWKMYERYISWQQGQTSNRKPYCPEIGVVIDERSFYYQQVPCREVFGRWVYESRMALSRVDTTVGFYLQSDLDKIPEDVTCLILLTPYRLTNDQKKVTQERFMKDGRTIIFCYLPDIFLDGEAPSGNGAFCGIDLKLVEQKIDPESQVVENDVLSDLEGMNFGQDRDYRYYPNLNAKHGKVSPYMCVDDPDAEIWAKYVENDLASCASKKMDGWNSIYLGTPIMEPSIWRRVFERSGCHLYLDPFSSNFDKPDVVEASDDFLMIQSSEGGKKTVRLPRKVEKVYRLDDAMKLTAEKTDHFEVELTPNVPAFFVME